MLIPILILIAILLFFLPKIIQMLGVHPHYEGKSYDLPNKKAFLTVVDGRIVTGQNQNAGKETAQNLLKLLEKKESKKA